MSTALVTGANRGIGLELAGQLSAKGYRVIGVCREVGPELGKIAARVEAGIELCSPVGVASLADRLHDESLDLVVNNAGVLHRDSLESMNFEMILAQIELNALAPLRLVHCLLPLLAKGAKLAMITSRMGSMADNSSGAYYGYRMSKAALNAASVSLARDLRDRGIVVVVLHPGYVRTKMTGQMGNIEPVEAARGLLARIEETTLERSGSFLHANGERLDW